MDYQTESDLQADDFVLTPNVWHTGKGDGKVYEKIVHEEDQAPARVFYGVDVDGTVSTWSPNNVNANPASITPAQPPVNTVAAPADEAGDQDLDTSEDSSDTDESKGAEEKSDAAGD